MRESLRIINSITTAKTLHNTGHFPFFLPTSKRTILTPFGVILRWRAAKEMSASLPLFFYKNTYWKKITHEFHWLGSTFSWFTSTPLPPKPPKSFTCPYFSRSIVPTWYGSTFYGSTFYGSTKNGCSSVYMSYKRNCCTSTQWMFFYVLYHQIYRYPRKQI